ncbi:hypothetical protein G5714_019537 [Onychostoma macrolepis]|uniref:Uncharacterized protein n=1 Tax=Onychostoma macrolepis TaxID=369639 RepID=A0A7J6BXB7_9TELE|nr:hypothetical protein G5714_019537 [Onychostoma macrolepis]
MEGFRCGLDNEIRFVLPMGDPHWTLKDYIKDYIKCTRVPTARLMDVPSANICLHIPVAPPSRGRAANQNALRTWTPFQRGLWS